MATVKIFFNRKKKSKDQKYPLTLRITHKRKTSYLFLDWINEQDWSESKMKVKKSHPNSQRLNHLIFKKLAEANDLILEYETKKKSYTSKDITEIIKGHRKEDSFFKIADEYIKELKDQGKLNRAIPDECRIKAFKKFLNHRDVHFHEITIPLLNKFKTHLIAHEDNSERSAINTLVVIRTLFNRGIQEKVADQKDYPFGKGKIQIKFPQSVKIGLDVKELIAIESLNLEHGSPIWHARNVFIFSFNLAGVRISDVLKIKWSDIHNDRLVYQMGKNDKVDSLKLSSKALTILSYYLPDKCKNDDFVFPELKSVDMTNVKAVYAKIKTSIKKINGYLEKIRVLAKIDKKITMHISRHSFGNIAGDKISPQMLQKLYRHSHLSTTIGYQGNFIHKDTDDALDAVINF